MARTFQIPQACYVCGRPTHENCDMCHKATCPGCLFFSGAMIEEQSDPRNEDYAESPTWQREETLCLADYTRKMGHSPEVLWQDTNMRVTLLARLAKVRAWDSIPAGDRHSWYRPPQAGAALKAEHGERGDITYDAFQLLQLLKFLQANEKSIREAARRNSDVLVPHEQQMMRRALKADAESGWRDEW